MNKYNPIVECNSETHPGVSFKIRTFSHGLRSKIRLELVKPSNKIREYMNQINELVEESGLVEDSPAEPSPIIEIVEKPQEDEQSSNRKKQELLEKIEFINNESQIVTATEVDPVYLRYAFVSISGFEIEGADAIDWKQLYDFAPEDLCQEIIARIKAEAGIAGYQRENLELPTTSGAVAGGQMNDSIAQNANVPANIEGETANDTSQEK